MKDFKRFSPILPHFQNHPHDAGSYDPYVFQTLGDWTITVVEDLKQLGKKEKFEQIARISEERIQNIVKDKIKSLSFTYHMPKKEKEKERSKVKQVKFHKLELQPSLLPNKMSTNTIDSIQLCKFFFSLRTCMVQVRENFKSSYADTNCHLCYQHVDYQQNLLNCKMLQDDSLVALQLPQNMKTCSQTMQKSS